MSARPGIAAVAVAALALGVPAVVSALPPGGIADTPGTPPGTLTITTPGGPANGRIGFCVTNLRVDTTSGPVAQQFMLKLDEHGSYGIGPYTPDANGSLCSEVSTVAADYANARGGAADKLPDDLCDTTKPHVLRLLSGTWGAEGTDPPASNRSISAAISVAGGECGVTKSGEPAPSPPPGTSPAPRTDPKPSGGGTTTTPVRLRSKTLTASGGRLRVRLRGGTAFTRGTVVVRTRDRVRLGRSRPARRTLAKGSFQLAAGDALDLRLRLTRDGRSLLRHRARVIARVTFTPHGADALTGAATVRRAKTTTTSWRS